MPDGTRWNFHSRLPRTIVCPALLPPWKRTTASARSASRSVTFPLPSSPHWAPTITMPGTVEEFSRAAPPPRARSCGVSGRGGVVRIPSACAGRAAGDLVGDATRVAAEERQELAHPLEPRHDPLAELLGQFVAA